MIPPFVSQMVGVLVRAVVVWVAGYLAANAQVTLSEDQIAQIVAYLVPIVGVVGWSVYSKYVGRQKLLTALATNGVITEKQVEKIVADPAVPTPSVMAGKTDLPLRKA